MNVSDCKVGNNWGQVNTECEECTQARSCETLAKGCWCLTLGDSSQYEEG